jgi:hypothetical protein
MLKNRTATGEHESECLLDMGIKIAHLSSDVANARSIDQAMHGAIELSEQTLNQPGARLAAIFSLSETSRYARSANNSTQQLQLHRRSRRSLER